MKIKKFEDFIRDLREGDASDRMSMGPYRELLPPAVHAIGGDLMPTGSNLPGWKKTIEREGLKLISTGGADHLPQSKSNDETRAKPFVDTSKKVKLTPVNKQDKEQKDS